MRPWEVGRDCLRRKGTASGSPAPRLMFITNGTSDWWNAVEKGMSDGAQNSGPRSR